MRRQGGSRGAAEAGRIRAAGSERVGSCSEGGLCRLGGGGAASVCLSVSFSFCLSLWLAGWR
eukprot:1774069-Rhodomonas_salina.1